jgi:hypothetical protein
MRASGRIVEIGRDPPDLHPEQARHDDMTSFMEGAAMERRCAVHRFWA